MVRRNVRFINYLQRYVEEQVAELGELVDEDRRILHVLVCTWVRMRVALAGNCRALFAGYHRRPRSLRRGEIFATIPTLLGTKNSVTSSG